MNTIEQQHNDKAKVPLHKYFESIAYKTFAQLRNWQETGQDYCMYTLHNEMHLLTKKDVASVQDFH